MTEANRPALDGHHAQTHDRFSRGAATPQRLEPDRIPELPRERQYQQDGDREPAGHEARSPKDSLRQAEKEQHHPEDCQIDDVGDAAGSDRRYLDVQTDRVRRDDGRGPLQRTTPEGWVVSCGSWIHSVTPLINRALPCRPRLTVVPDSEGSPTDLDGFIEQHRDTWSRLDALTRHATRNIHALDPIELDELVRLHLRTSSHLSTVRTQLADPDLAGHLSNLVARSSSLVHGTRARTFRTLWRSLTQTFPAAVWHIRRPIAVSTLVFLISAVSVGLWLANSDAAVAASMPEEVRQSYIEQDFEAYYSSEPGTTFAARVFTNNAAVGGTAFALGVLFGIPTVGILVLNGVNVGLAGGMFHAAGDPGHFWGLILPHGLLELTAIFVAGGAGLRLGWVMLAPGDRARRQALIEEGQRCVVIVVGLVLVFLVAGLLEGYVTAAPWPTWARVGTGAVVWLAFCLWMFIAGRLAAARGFTGALSETAAGFDVEVDVSQRRGQLAGSSVDHVGTGGT